MTFWFAMNSTPPEAHPSPGITVWAPRAQRVELDLHTPGHGAHTVAMHSKGDGWWVWDEADATAYPWLDYAFRVDGGEPTPDPRTAWQPHGVHGTSRWFHAGG